MDFVENARREAPLTFVDSGLFVVSSESWVSDACGSQNVGENPLTVRGAESFLIVPLEGETVLMLLE